MTKNMMIYLIVLGEIFEAGCGVTPTLNINSPLITETSHSNVPSPISSPIPSPTPSTVPAVLNNLTCNSTLIEVTVTPQPFSQVIQTPRNIQYTYNRQTGVSTCNIQASSSVSATSSNDQCVLYTQVVPEQGSVCPDIVFMGGFNNPGYYYATCGHPINNSTYFSSTECTLN